jgi:phosphoglycolate phosphatase
MAAQGHCTDRLLIFDLDGTLYRTESSFVPTMRTVYAEVGLPYPSDRAILGLVGEPFPVFLDWLVDQGFPADRNALAQRISEVELASIRARGALFPGVRETLATLRETGHAVSLCTNGDLRYADAVLSACGILHLFDELQTNEVEGHSKAELVRDLLRRVPHKKAFMIGDRYHDVEAGRANGCTVIGATYGYGPLEELETADHRIDTFPDLLSCLS